MGSDEHIWFHFFGATTARCNFKHEVSVSTTWGNLHRDLTLLCPLYLTSFTPVLPLSSVHHTISFPSLQFSAGGQFTTLGTKLFETRTDNNHVFMQCLEQVLSTLWLIPLSIQWRCCRWSFAWGQGIHSSEQNWLFFLNGQFLYWDWISSAWPRHTLLFA